MGENNVKEEKKSF